MNIIGIVGLCLVVTVICKIFEKTNKEYSFIIMLMTMAFILLLTIKYISPLISKITEVFALTGVSNEYLNIICKALGICYLTQLGCDYCKDANENSLSSILEIAGKVSLLIIALPLFSNLIDIVKELLSL